MPAFGIRALLLAVAVVFFFIAWISDSVDVLDHWIPLGLLALALAFLVDALGMDRRLGGGPTTRP
jgi:hypothetical protein